MSSKNVLPPG